MIRLRTGFILRSGSTVVHHPSKGKRKEHWEKIGRGGVDSKGFARPSQTFRKPFMQLMILCIATSRAMTKYLTYSRPQEYDQHVSDRVSAAMLSAPCPTLHSHSQALRVILKEV
jgi:hypothetical protein